MWRPGFIVEVFIQVSFKSAGLTAIHPHRRFSLTRNLRKRRELKGYLEIELWRKVVRIPLLAYIELYRLACLLGPGSSPTLKGGPCMQVSAAAYEAFHRGARLSRHRSCSHTVVGTLRRKPLNGTCEPGDGNPRVHSPPLSRRSRWYGIKRHLPAQAG